MKRIAHLAEKYARQLARCADDDGGPRDPGIRISLLLAGSAPDARQYAEAIVRWHAKGVLPLDRGALTIAHDALALLNKIGKYLPAERRNPMAIEHPDKLVEALSLISRKDEKRSRARASSEKMRSESIIHEETDACIIATPLTAAAAALWGRGTKWCTAMRAEGAEHFANHSRKSPLFVVAGKGGDKFQWSSGTANCRDALNRPVSAEEILSVFPTIATTERALVHLALADPDATPSTPGWTVPSSLAEECIIASPRALERTPEKTAPLCALSAAIWPATLLHVPDELKTDEMEMAAVSADGNAIAHVRRQTPELVRAAMDADPLVIKHLVEQTDAMVMEAVARHRDALAFVRKQTPAISEFAALAHPTAIRHDVTKDSKARLIAVSADPETIGDIEEPDRELRLIALRKDGSVLRFLPQHTIDAVECEIAVANDPQALRYVPPWLKTRSMVLDCLRIDGRLLSCAGKIDAELVNVAMKSTPAALKHVPPRFLDRKLILSALRRDGRVLSALRKGPRRKHLDAEAVTVAMTSAAAALLSAPKTLLTKELCLDAIRRDGTLLSFVPVALRNSDICEVAAKSHGDAWRLTPGPIRTPAVAARMVKICPAIWMTLPKRISRHPDVLAALPSGNRSRHKNIVEPPCA
jgi:hypothetical protein